MKLIAHRGNLSGPWPEQENRPLYIDAAIGAGCDAEVDLWEVNGMWMLGHDEPKHIVPHKWLLDRAARLWLHCKHLSSLNRLVEEGDLFNFFWHENDQYALTSKGYIWTNPGNLCGQRSVLVNLNGQEDYTFALHYGICTDYPLKYRR